MLKNCAFFLLCILSLQALGEGFLRIDEHARQLKIAFKTYERQKDKRKVILMAMLHMGDASFYKLAGDKLDGLTALYESVNLTEEDKKRLYERINSLGSYYKEIYNSPELSSIMLSPGWQNLLALAYGLVNQDDVMSYDKAKKLIHADLYDAELAKKFINREELALKESMDKSIPLMGKMCIGLCKIVTNYGYSLLKNMNWYLGKKESFLRALLEAHFSGKSDKEFEDRTNIIISKLKPLIDAAEWPNDVAVVYGAKHLALIETFLEENGFKLIDTEWVTLSSLDQE